MTNVSFHDDSTVGNCVLQLSVSSKTKAGIKAALEDLISQIDDSYGKPRQGGVSSYDHNIHVITPIWNGQEY